MADAAVGYTPCLETLYAAGVIPIVDIRQHSTDEDPDACLWRGYDEHGRPLCPHGYPLAFNGLDYQRLRATWVCHQGCRRAAEAAPEEVACPFRDAERPLGLVRHVKNRFTHPDGTHHARLARLFAYRSPHVESALRQSPQRHRESQRAAGEPATQTRLVLRPGGGDGRSYLRRSVDQPAHFGASRAGGRLAARLTCRAGSSPLWVQPAADLPPRREVTFAT